MGTKQEGPRGFDMRDAPGSEAAAPEEPGRVPEPPGFTFASLVLSLSTSALMHLGVAPGQESSEGEQKREINRAAASQVIDILEMLREKTRGNLEGDESDLLVRVLHDLHMRYVESAKP